MKYELAIFDLDGTLLDTSPGILKSVEYTIRHFGFSPVPKKLLSSFIGPPIQDSFARIYGLSGSILQEIATVFRADYSCNNLLKAKPYNGIYELFDRLYRIGIKIAVATYKREDYAVKLLKSFGFNRYTDIIYGGDHENELKKKDIIVKCIKAAGIRDNADVIMVGDTLHDALAAMDIKLDFIAVTYGFGFDSKTIYENKVGKYIGHAETPIDIFKLIISENENQSSTLHN